MQIGMNLKPLSRRTKTLRVGGAGEGLIATSTSPLAASPIGAPSAIASPWIAWIARAVESGIIAAQPTGNDPAPGPGRIAPIRQGAVAWRAAICAAVLQTPHQQVANRRCTADRNCESRDLACHDCFSREIAPWRFIVHCKSARYPCIVAESDRPV